MSGTFKFKRIYSEGVAEEHPDLKIARQTEFANKADEILARRKKDRAQSGKNAKLDAIGRKLYNMNKIGEEVELGEEKRPYPFKRVEAQTERARKGSVYGRGRDNNSPISDSEMEATRRVNKMSIVSAAETRKKQKADRNEEFELGEAHWDPATKTISDKKRTGTDPEIQKMAAKAAASGPKKRKPLGSVRKNSADFKPSSPEQAKADKKSWDNYWEGSWKNKKMNEKIDVGADAGATISDFVHSKSKTFKGDSKKQRIKRALGAYYAAQKEETENIYDYVIETLVDSDFAQDYETAENMFEHMSDEFVAVILEDYIEEAKRSKSQKRTANAGKKGYDAKGNPIPKVSKTHVIHDVDDNVADQRHPDAAKIDLHKKDSGSYKHVKAMTPSEFAHTPLEPKHEYGFDEFRAIG